MAEKMRQNSKSDSLVAKFTPEFLTLLENREQGFDDLDNFLSPKIDALRSPFEICNMDKASERVRLAIENKEKILIFGDYDCDGVMAVTTLVLHLRQLTDVQFFVPNRSEHGYGMSIRAIDDALKSCKPSLVITVDCGITAVSEVEYLKSLGIDVIVTDHHEPQDGIPDCIVVDPKVQKQGFFEYCGAGLALKLIEAISGRDEAMKYIDLCAIATVADVVPLVDDNRILAYHGINAMNKSPRRAVGFLRDNQPVTSSLIMFKIAPKINAAGRVADASQAVNLFLEEEYFFAKTLADELATINKTRQNILEKVTDEAKEQLSNIDQNETKIIVLKSADWDAGVIGITASRLVDSFGCPVILFSEKDGMLKGSARSNSKINLFLLLRQFESFFETFGGHSQAAGLSLSSDKFDEFRVAINEYCRLNFDDSDFDMQPRYDLKLDKKCDFVRLAKEIQMLEPTGQDNPKPKFMFELEGINFENIGFSKHIKAKKNEMEFLAFTKYADAKLFAKGRSDVLMSLEINEFQNNLTPQGKIASFSAKRIELSDSDCMSMCLGHLSFGCTKDGTKNDSKNAIKNGSKNKENAIDSICVATQNDVDRMLELAYGTLFVVFSQDEYENLQKAITKTSQLPLIFAVQNSLNTKNAVVLCPGSDFDFSFYSNIIIAGSPMSMGYADMIANSCKRCWSLGEIKVRKMQNITDDVLRQVYVALRNSVRNKSKFKSLADLYLQIKLQVDVDFNIFDISIRIFADLGLILISDKGIIELVNKKINLGDSVIYRNLMF